MNTPNNRTANNQLDSRKLLCIAFLFIFSFSGCAEGPLWQAGKYSPWARNRWAEEEKIAVSIFTRKDEMNQLVSAAKIGSQDQMESAAEKLSQIFERDPVLIMRLHSVKLLGELNCPTSIRTLRSASSDHVADIRIAAIQSWSKMSGETAIPELQEMIGSDTNIDVRLAATRALGNFQGQQAVQALSLALDDTDPALQLRAAESLASVTGESHGRDVKAWKNHVRQMIGPTDMLNAPGESRFERVADESDESRFR